MAESEDVKPGSEQLTIVIQLADGSAPLKMKVKKNTAFTKIFAAFYKNKGMQADSVQFMFQGKKVQGDQSPESLDMEDSDVVDAMLNQTGGGA